MLRARTVAAALFWPGIPLLYLAIPGHPLAFFSGLPLGPPALALALLIGLSSWSFWTRPRASGMLVPTSVSLGSKLALLGLLAIGLKVSAAALAAPYGLVATYSGPEPGRPAERSTEWTLPGATRIDRELEFVGDRFPVHFFNDLRRFNFYTLNQPRRDLLPFSASWRGWIANSTEDHRCFRLEANGPATLRIGAATVNIERASHLEMRELCQTLAPGLAEVHLQFARAENSVPFLRVTKLRQEGQDAPLAPVDLLQEPVSRDDIERDQYLQGAAYALDVLFATLCLAIMAAQSYAWFRAGATSSPGSESSRGRPLWERPLLAIGVLAAFVEALVANRHFAGRTAILSGGNDWLAYESFARDVLLNGLLMNGGRPLGQGETFYYQPLYVYFLAGLHAALGESVYGLLLAQYVLVAVAGVLTYFVARELFGRGPALMAFGLFWVLRYLIFNQVAGLLLSENLVAVLIPLMLLLLARWRRTWQRADLAAGGVVLGLAILTRSTPLLFLPPAMLGVVLAQFRKFRQWRPALGGAAMLLVFTFAVFSLAGLRNLIVAGRPALLPESASANLYEVHRPSAKVNLSRIERNPIYNRLGLDRQTREVLEFLRQDPIGYASTLAPMALYAVGVTGPALGTAQIQYELVALSALYFAGLFAVPRARIGPAWFLHAFVLTHLLQMTVFMSHQYGFRLPLPMYGPMTVVAGLVLVQTAEALRHLPRQLPVHWIEGKDARFWRASRIATSIPLLVALLWSATQIARPTLAEERLFGLGGDAGAAARAVANAPKTFLADRIYFSGADARSFGVSYLPGLRYREMKWLQSDATDEQANAFVWPPPSRTGALVTFDERDLPRAACIDGSSYAEGLGRLANSRERERQLYIWHLPGSDQSPCALRTARVASFGRTVELLAVQVERSVPKLRVTWRVTERPSTRTQAIVEGLDDPGTVLWAQTADPYPSGSWESGEIVVAEISLRSALGDLPRHLAVGFTQGSTGTRLSIDDPLTLYGQTRVTARE